MIHISQNLKSTLQFDENLLSDGRIVSNVARFCQLAADAVLQGKPQKIEWKVRRRSKSRLIHLIFNFFNRPFHSWS